MSKGSGVDKIFLFSVIVLLVIGLIVFISASMGILATSGVEQFGSTTFKQIFFGILLGLIACFLFSHINYKFYKKHALIIFVVSLFITAITLFHTSITPLINGARRWIVISGLSFQPVALLNIGFVAYWAAWLSSIKDKVRDIKYGFLPLIVIFMLIGAILLKQADNGSFFVLCIAGVAMFLVAGGKFRYIFLVGFIGVLCVGILALTKPYVMSRIETFLNPSENSLTSGYQVQQSLIAIGSGEFFGRGLGQSIQKYKYLPVSISDSIFAVLGEEMGFIGCLSVIALFLFFIFRGFRIAVKAPDTFSGLFVVGIVIIITVQSFVNIASTIGIIPFSGVPLAFFSQGGTSMLMMLAEIGMILNISKFNKS